MRYKTEERRSAVANCFVMQRRVRALELYDDIESICFLISSVENNDFKTMNRTQYLREGGVSGKDLCVLVHKNHSFLFRTPLSLQKKKKKNALQMLNMMIIMMMPLLHLKRSARQGRGINEKLI